MTSNLLLINSVEIQDSGGYKCVAVNRAGQATSEAAALVIFGEAVLETCHVTRTHTCSGLHLLTWYYINLQNTKENINCTHAVLCIEHMFISHTMCQAQLWLLAYIPIPANTIILHMYVYKFHAAQFLHFSQISKPFVKLNFTKIN